MLEPNIAKSLQDVAENNQLNKIFDFFKNRKKDTANHTVERISLDMRKKGYEITLTDVKLFFKKMHDLKLGEYGRRDSGYHFFKWNYSVRDVLDAKNNIGLLCSRSRNSEDSEPTSMKKTIDKIDKVGYDNKIEADISISLKDVSYEFSIRGDRKIPFLLPENVTREELERFKSFISSIPAN